ncbi:GDP dissociation inhibitor [Kalmanozyma brasiliensis GHG001]|uniref:Rab proteins geranylgeranyltransferase component A n=1 Tax=Kalmanozyma brasiliensis (strain GHG001) TaxID=1365824 RepID=V5F044_KALBG|nr:GDP dissociation inhibitor [Kalmanozyma brasiliensis GHG001]EST09633.1 GDP dissociation inhibitor [Kalmanozyma brasiliensis GHG001]
MSLDQTHYDVAILSTGLTQSIVSAALAAAGLSVIHIDRNDYYADQWASLTLSELLKWTQDTSSGVEGVRLSFPSTSRADTNKSGEPSRLPESLASLDRHYAISLAPTLLPATGPSIDCLIRSKVSSYATFRLLERTCVASVSSHDDGPMLLTSVPASKEDIFKTKTLSLIAKRKLMKLLMYIGTEDWQSDLAQNPDTSQRSFVEYLADVHKMSPDLVDAVAYGVCLCATPNETTEVAMARAKSHMQSVGRYGNSAYLVGQYGGAGELAQGYCRASAVKGGMFILAHEIKSAKRDAADARWEIGIDGIDDTVTADYIVSSEEMLQQLGITDPGQTSAPGSADIVLHKAVLVLDKPIHFAAAVGKDSSTGGQSTQGNSPEKDASESPPETGLVVFPPGSIGGNVNTVTVLMMGEGTFSCPKGQYVYYVQSEASQADRQQTAEDALKPVLEQIINLTTESRRAEAADAASVHPLLQLTYRQAVPSTSSESSLQNLSSITFPPTSTDSTSSNTQHPVTSISGLTDAAVQLAEKVYYDVFASRLTSPDCGSTHKERVKWVKETVESQRLERKRRKGRDPAEYQGRGGRGADDGVTRLQPDGEGREESQEQVKVVGFFEAISGQDDGDDDDDAHGDGQ